MANTQRTYGGLKPIGHINGSPYNGAHNLYVVDSSDGTALFIGDPVKTDATIGCDATGVPAVIKAGAGDAIRGVVVGFKANPDNLTLNYRTASTTRYVMVADDPDLLFEIEEDSVGGALTATNCGNNGDIAVGGGGSTTSGLSSVRLDSSDVIANTTTSAQLRVIRLVPREDNVIGDYAKWVVRINEHELRQTTGV